MKRPRKWVLGGIFALTGGAVLFWLDILHRAEEAIAAHERQIREDIAELRRRPNLKEVLRSRPLTHDTLHDLGERGGLVDVPAGRWLSYEQEVETREEIEKVGWDWLRMGFEERDWTPETILTCLIANQEAFREGGWGAWHAMRENRLQLLNAWRQLLVSKPPTADQLREVHEGLALLEATEPREAETDRIDCLLKGLDILHVIHQRADPTNVFTRDPCWRELFSWRILAAKSLRQLRLDPKGGGDPHFPPRSTGGTSESTPTVWGVARTATAIALFRAEKGYFPDVLEELVPEYVPETPRDSEGIPIRLEDYFLDRPPGSAVPWDQWPLIRQ